MSIEQVQQLSPFQFLFDYIVGDIRAKRQRLHSNTIDKAMFGDFEIINHTEVEAWRERLNID
jgi:hypothetical protein